MMNKSWIDEAKCKGQTHLFFGEYNERPSARRSREKKAVAICESCSVMLQCRQYARSQDELGVWGGETEEDRYRAGFLKSGDITRRIKARDRRSTVR